MSRAAQITKPQIRAIRARQHKIGMDDPTYRALLDREFSATSTKDLDMTQGNRLMQIIFGKINAQGQEKIPKSSKPRPIRNRAAKDTSDKGKVVTLQTLLQRRLIAALTKEIVWRSAGGFDAWLSASLGIDRVVTSQQAAKAINGLKGLKKSTANRGVKQ